MFLTGRKYKIMKGNVGMWDQVLALKWIKENARKFGGDPEKITLFGESAGGSAVNLLMLSPETQGIAKRGIIQSGTLNAPWSHMEADRALAISLSLLDDCSCNTSRVEVRVCLIRYFYLISIGCVY